MSLVATTVTRTPAFSVLAAWISGTTRDLSSYARGKNRRASRNARTPQRLMGAAKARTTPRKVGRGWVRAPRNPGGDPGGAGSHREHLEELVEVIDGEGTADQRHQQSAQRDVQGRGRAGSG